MKSQLLIPDYFLVIFSTNVFLSKHDIIIHSNFHFPLSADQSIFTLFPFPRKINIVSDKTIFPVNISRSCFSKRSDEILHEAPFRRKPFNSWIINQRKQDKRKKSSPFSESWTALPWVLGQVREDILLFHFLIARL